MRARVLAALALLALAAAPPAHAEGDAPDVVVELDPGLPPLVVEGRRFVESVGDAPGESVALTLAPHDALLVVEFRSRGYFDVERARQVRPTFNGSLFALVAGGPRETDGTALVANYTGAPANLTITLGIPASDPRGLAWTGRALSLARDVAPPGFEIGEPWAVTHQSFLLNATTSEPALADLRIAPASGGPVVRNPTPDPAVRQTFPVQGLRAATDYAYHVVFEDWSGNVATSPAFRLRTRDAPALPAPRVLGVSPPPNATLGASVRELLVAFESPDSPIPQSGVRLFVDKREVTGLLLVEKGRATYAPPTPLGPGPHSASVEIQNAAGGQASYRWTFAVAGAVPDVEGERAASAPGLALAALAALVAAAGARALRRD